MRFNIVKMVGICYKCPRTVFLRDLAVDVAGISTENLKEYIEDHNADERMKAGFEEAMLSGLLGQDHSKQVPTARPVELPENFRLLSDGHASVIGKRAMAYMLNRRFNASVLTEMGFGYCSSGPYENRIIIPFYESGVLVYWQARDFTGTVDDRDKIKNPWSGTTPQGKSDVLFNYDGVRDIDSTVVMTESWGSALAVGRSAFAINGKSMSDIQLVKIAHMAAKVIVVLLDSGTQSESWKIASRLHAETNKTIAVADLPTGDPADVLRSVLLDSVKHAERYTAEGHIKAVARSVWN